MTSSQRRRSNARTPVTIDLEAQKIEDESSDTSDTDALSPYDDVAAGDSDNVPSPEPVAPEMLDEKPVTEEASAESADNDSAAEAGSAPTPQPSSKRGGSPIIAGLIGGIIALGGGAGLQYAGILPSGGSSVQQEQVDIAPLQTQIDALKAQLESASAGSASAALPESVTKSLKGAVENSDKALAGVQTVEQSVTDLTSKIDGLQASVSNGGAGENAGLVTLTKRVEGIEGQLSDVAGKVTALGESAGSGADIDAALAPVTEKLGTIEGDIATQGEKITALSTDMSDKITALNTRVGDAESKIADSGSNVSVAKAIAAAGLKSAIDRGSSFMSELEAYATVEPQSKIVTELRNYAASGVPTINQLTDSFSSVANSIVATGQGLAADASITDRLMASARSLVQIRPKGEVVGDTPGDIAARIEERLKKGNLTDALAQWDTLPDAAKAVSADFADQMRARKSVDAMVSKALTGAMSVAAPSATPAPAAN